MRRSLKNELRSRPQRSDINPPMVRGRWFSRESVVISYNELHAPAFGSLAP